MPTDIFFPEMEPTWVFDRDCVRFYAVVDGSPLRCLVTVEALMSHFGLRAPDPEAALQVFLDHQTQIQEAAFQKIETGETGSSDELVLRSDDFPGPTTTTPTLGDGLEISEDPQIRLHSTLLDSIRSANGVLRNDLYRVGMAVEAAWRLLPAGSREPLLVLKLTDKESGATVEEPFSASSLRDQTSAYFTLFRLWDNLLRVRRRRLVQAASPSSTVEE